MCIVHLFNTSIIHIFYRTQVLLIGQKFSKIFDKNFSLHNMLSTYLFYLPKAFPKIFKIFLLNLSKLQLLVFQCLKLEIVNDFWFKNFLLLLYSSHLLKMNSHSNLDFFETSSLLVHIPANVGSQHIDNITP